MVTINSPGGVLPRWFSPFVNKSPVSNLYSAAFNYLVICLCYHAYYMLIDLINSLSFVHSQAMSKFYTAST